MTENTELNFWGAAIYDILRFGNSNNSIKKKTQKLEDKVKDFPYIEKFHDWEVLNWLSITRPIKFYIMTCPGWFVSMHLIIARKEIFRYQPCKTFDIWI